MTIRSAAVVLVLVAATSASLAAPDPNSVGRSARPATNAEESTPAAAPPPDTDAVLARLDRALDRYGLGPYYRDVFLPSFPLPASEIGPGVFLCQWLDRSADDRRLLDRALADLLRTADYSSDDGSAPAAATPPPPLDLAELLDLHERDPTLQRFEWILYAVEEAHDWDGDGSWLDRQIAFDDRVVRAFSRFRLLDGFFTRLERGFERYLESHG